MFSEANSLRSRSLSGKFTNVVSLLVRILDSENRFRSVIAWSQGQQAGRESLGEADLLRKQGTQRNKSTLFCPHSAPLPFTSPPWGLRIRSTKIFGNRWTENFFIHRFLARQRQHVCKARQKGLERTWPEARRLKGSLPQLGTVKVAVLSLRCDLLVSHPHPTRPLW